MKKTTSIIKKFAAFLADDPNDPAEVAAIINWLTEIGYTGYLHPLSKTEIEELIGAYHAYLDGERYRLAD